MENDFDLELEYNVLEKDLVKLSYKIRNDYKPNEETYEEEMIRLYKANLIEFYAYNDWKKIEMLCMMIKSQTPRYPNLRDGILNGLQKYQELEELIEYLKKEIE